MKEYNKQLDRMAAQMIPQLKAAHPKLSDDIIETRAYKAAANALKDPITRIFY